MPFILEHILQSLNLTPLTISMAKEGEKSKDRHENAQLSNDNPQRKQKKYSLKNIILMFFSIQFSEQRI